MRPSVQDILARSPPQPSSQALSPQNHPGKDTTIHPNKWVAKLKRVSKEFQEDAKSLRQFLNRLSDAIHKKTTEFDQKLLQLKEDTEDAKSLSFVNMTQFTKSLHENQQAHNQATQQISEYFSGNSEIDIMKSLQELIRVNDELKVKGLFLDRHRFSEVKRLNEEIKTISKVFIELQSYFVQVGQTGFVEQLKAIQKDLHAANANFGAYFLKNYEETDRKYQEKRKDTSAPKSIDL